MAYSFVQSGNGSQVQTNTATVAPSATTEGNLVVVSIRMNTNAETCTSVTDDKGNTYVLQAYVDGSTNIRMYQAYGIQVTGGTTLITASFSGTSMYKYLIFSEFGGFNAGLKTSDVFGVSTTGAGTDSPTAVSTLTTGGSGELIVATICADNNITWSAGTNYTLSTNPANDTPMRTQYRLSSGATETAPTSFTQSGGYVWSERATAFRNPTLTPIGSFLLTFVK